MVIYNPYAGAKRKFLPGTQTAAPEDIKLLLERYQIPSDFFATQYPGHATVLAGEARKKGYKTVLAAGGDGTVGEVASGLVDTGICLGILPLGSFMNAVRMLSIPTDLERAVALIKTGKVRKIDVGIVSKLGGKRVDKPYYFIESAGIGLNAQLQQHILKLESGDIDGLTGALKTLFDFYSRKTSVTIDAQEVASRAAMITVSNGPFMATSLPVAPEAKLNDHKLTVSFYNMSKFEIIWHFLKALGTNNQPPSAKITRRQGKKVVIKTLSPKIIHADARVLGTTPVELRIKPNALNVITG